MKGIRKLRMLMIKFETYIIVTLLLSLISIGFIQVLLRKFLNSSIPDADLLVTMLVYYIALFGASLATLQNKHIHIEILSKMVSERVDKIFNVLSQIFSISILVILLDASLEYVSLQSDSIDMFLSSIPTVYAEAIIIPAFILMIIAFILNTILVIADWNSVKEVV